MNTKLFFCLVKKKKKIHQNLFSEFSFGTAALYVPWMMGAGKSGSVPLKSSESLQYHLSPSLLIKEHWSSSNTSAESYERAVLHWPARRYKNIAW